jgi:hypothetical protein
MRRRARWGEAAAPRSSLAPIFSRPSIDVIEKASGVGGGLMIGFAAKLIGAAAVTALFMSVANAQTATPTKLRPKPNASGGSTIAVTVYNKRDVGLAELDIAQAGVPTFKPFVRKLPAGKSTVINLPKDESCVFDFYVKYDNGETNAVSGFNVCEDGKINLVE